LDQITIKGVWRVRGFGKIAFNLTLPRLPERPDIFSAVLNFSDFLVANPISMTKIDRLRFVTIDYKSYLSRDFKNIYSL